MSYSTIKASEKISNLKEQWDDKVPQFQSKINKMYANNGDSGYNPFLGKNGLLINPYINYQAALDNPNITQKAKMFIAQATGLAPTQSAPVVQNPGDILTADTSAINSMSSNEVSAPNGNKFVDTAKKYLGTKYVWGGNNPSGFDCSGLMQYTFAQNGIKIPRTAREQYKGGSAVAQGELQAGDLVFFKGSTGDSTSPGHVGMYIGNGQYIQAPKTGDVVKISNLADRNDYVGARRYY